MYTEVNLETKRVVTYGIDYLKSENEVLTWVTDNWIKGNVPSAYWDKMKEHMLANTPNLKFDVGGHFSVDITKDAEPFFVKGILDNFTNKLKYKKYQPFAQWVVCLQDYLLDTDWKAKAKEKPSKKKVDSEFSIKPRTSGRIASMGTNSASIHYSMFDTRTATIAGEPISFQAAYNTVVQSRRRRGGTAIPTEPSRTALGAMQEAVRRSHVMDWERWVRNTDPQAPPLPPTQPQAEIVDRNAARYFGEDEIPGWDGLPPEWGTNDTPQ